MLAFLSHNEADKATARLLAVALVESGTNVWFDEWSLRPGDSIPGGVGDALAICDAFILIWSESAALSNWVGTEMRAAITRRVSDQNLRLIPVVVDDAPLPTLFAEYKGFSLCTLPDLRRIASEISGNQNSKDLAQMLQRRLHELAAAELAPDNPIRVIVCPECSSQDLSIERGYDGYSDSSVYFVMCQACTWGAARKVLPTTQVRQNHETPSGP